MLHIHSLNRHYKDDKTMQTIKEAVGGEDKTHKKLE